MKRYLLPRSRRAVQSACALLLLADAASAQDTFQLSGSVANPGNGRSEVPHMSADGRFVVWQTLASNLVAGDGNNTFDVLLLDRDTGVTELVSRTPQGTAANGGSTQPTISADGRFIAFYSGATDIQPGQANGPWVYDRVLGTHERATTWSGSAVTQDTRISGNGRYVVYLATAALLPEDTNDDDDVYRYDRVTDTLELVSIDAGGNQSNNDCLELDVSGNGRWIVFRSAVANGVWGGPGFTSQAHLWLKDMQTGSIVPISTTTGGAPASGPCDQVRLSADGTWLTFQTAASNMVPLAGVLQVATKDLVTGEVHLVSGTPAGVPGDNYSREPSISADGRFVLFRSTAANLGGNNSYWTLFVRDQVEGSVTKVSLSSAATGHVENNASSYGTTLDVTGRYALFSSLASNLVAGDTNALQDVFLRDVTGSGPIAYGWNDAQSTGCVPQIQFSGTPSASAGSGFDVSLTNVRGAQPGLLIYSKSGAAVLPMLGERLYVAAPIVRTPAQASGGAPGGCNGSFTFDFNTWTANGPDGGLVAGTSVWCQYWSRDPGDLHGSHLSAAVAFHLGP